MKNAKSSGHGVDQIVAIVLNYLPAQVGRWRRLPLLATVVLAFAGSVAAYAGAVAQQQLVYERFVGRDAFDLSHVVKLASPLALAAALVGVAIALCWSPRRRMQVALAAMLLGTLGFFAGLAWANVAAFTCLCQPL